MLAVPHLAGSATIAPHPAVLFLLLLSAGVNKWQDLTPSGSRALAAGQLALSSGIGFVLFSVIVYSTVLILRNRAAKHAAAGDAASQDDASGDVAKPGSAEARPPTFVNVTAAGPVDTAVDDTRHECYSQRPCPPADRKPMPINRHPHAPPCSGLGLARQQSTAGASQSTEVLLPAPADVQRASGGACSHTDAC